ncbi:early protein E1 [Saimiri sciureus papillomavirus 1]|uniref:Replication protein E1 n=1 Tax=Saimiri sciureus papillomavirus 1 TaxID=990304 RepID=W5QK93_9PAPI|nr:early protein E1 [Saimiri sciureus papillomavirus 1]AEA35057.1 early protein E1 [Saimiri sciureus papillomavirus 1]
MASPPGTSKGNGAGWLLVEADVHRPEDCSTDEDEDSDLEAQGFDVVDFINDSESLGSPTERAALYNTQCATEDATALQALKRKYLKSPYNSPHGHVIDGNEVNELSPRICAINLGKPSQKAKRRLFERQQQDSGYGYSLEVETQTTDETPIQVEEGAGAGDATGASQESGSDSAGGTETVGDNTQTGPEGAVLKWLQGSNLRATLLGKFKECYGVGFTDLVRQFKSDKTCCWEWVVAAFGMPVAVAESLKTTIQPLCTYAHIQTTTCSLGGAVLILASFKASKNRQTVKKAMGTLMNIPEDRMLIEPPKLKSMPAALYWFKTSMSNVSEVFGEPPDWLKRQTQLNHCFEDDTFNLSHMVQWAYDNKYTDDSTIAYEYACIGDTDSNAAAFLKSNCQAKYVKDCGVMVRHYLRAEMRKMSMAEWIEHCSSKVEEDGDWRTIVRFLRYQGIEFVSFCRALKDFLKGVPKRNCIVLCGPPNTGKSWFGMSLMTFLQGKVLSYCNAASHFWLQPLGDTKIAMIDDATPQCWDYMDTYMRNALDGNPICVDRKHKEPTQIKCPPLLITSNTNIKENDRWRYLWSRHTMFMFPNEMPFTPQGTPVYELSNANWKSFFGRSWAQLDLGDREDVQDNGRANQPFRCVAGTADRLL